MPDGSGTDRGAAGNEGPPEVWGPQNDTSMRDGVPGENWIPDPIKVDRETKLVEMAQRIIDNLPSRAVVEAAIDDAFTTAKQRTIIKKHDLAKGAVD